MYKEIFRILTKYSYFNFVSGYTVGKFIINKDIPPFSIYNKTIINKLIIFSVYVLAPIPDFQI